MKYILKKGLGLFLAVSVILSSFVVMKTSETGIAFAKTKTEKQVAKKVRTAVQNNVYKNVLLADGRTVKEADYDGGCFDVGDHGSITFLSPNKKKGTESFPPAESTTMGEDYFRDHTITYQISDPSVVEIDESMHTYRTVSGGSASVTMSVSYDVPVDPTVTGEAVELTTKTLTATMLFIVSSDTSQVTLDRYDATIYMTSEYMDGKAEFQMINCPNLKYHNLSVTSSNDKMDISLILDQNKPFFTITCNTAGKTKVTAKLNNTVFTITISVVWLTPSHTSKVLDQGQSFTLKLKNWPEKPAWKSTDPKVATVSSSGVVKGKKVGNAIIYMDIQGNRTGCIVSVVKKGISKVVKRATWIGDHWKYSQPLRMRKGYYDCSSLVWKAYRTSGRYVCGARYYAPVAADIGHWGVMMNRNLGKFREKKIDDLAYLPGDCLIKVHMRSDRYLGIGHIEMITGYSLHGFIGTKPVLYLTWGARDEDYGATRADDFVIRPYN